MNNKQSEEYLKKNKPNKILPIINSCFGGIFLAGSIFCKIKYNDIYPTVYFILFNILVILFPLASWYNSYFSKIINTRRINNYDLETKEIVSYIKRLQSYKGVELNKDKKLKAKIEYTDEIIDKQPSYNLEHFSLGLPKENPIIITFGIGFAGIELKSFNKEIVGLCGVLPRSVWRKKNLKVPNAKKGKVHLEPIGFEFCEKQVIQALKSMDTYYDNKTGWIVIGEYKDTPLNKTIEIMNDTYLVIRNDEVIAIWFKIENNLAI